MTAGLKILINTTRPVKTGARVMVFMDIKIASFVSETYPTSDTNLPSPPVKSALTTLELPSVITTATISNISSEPVPNKKSGFCKYCRKIFSDLEKHSEKIHANGNTQKAQFICLICPAMFVKENR